MIFGRLGLDGGAMEREALPALLGTHMRELSKAIVCPRHHREVLMALKRRHRLAVVSNFDYTPTARLVLEREGLADLFDEILVSDAVGWRKPAPRIFQEALDRMRLAPAEAVFVGDRADIDVAARAGGDAGGLDQPGGRGAARGRPGSRSRNTRFARASDPACTRRG
jgi:putative hydrolase of the HAD superfamily